MTRRIALFVAALALSACATPRASPPPIEPPKPKAADVRLCDEVPDQPRLPRGADLVQPETAAEKLSFDAFMTAIAKLVDHDTQVTDRAKLAKKETCPPGV